MEGAAWSWRPPPAPVPGNLPPHTSCTPSLPSRGVPDAQKRGHPRRRSPSFPTRQDEQRDFSQRPASPAPPCRAPTALTSPRAVASPTLCVHAHGGAHEGTRGEPGPSHSQWGGAGPRAGPRPQGLDRVQAGAGREGLQPALHPQVRAPSAHSDPYTVHGPPSTCSLSSSSRKQTGPSGRPWGAAPGTAGPDDTRAPGQDQETCPSRHRAQSRGRLRGPASNSPRAHGRPVLGQCSGTSPAWSSRHTAPIPEGPENVLFLLPGSQALCSAIPPEPCPVAGPWPPCRPHSRPPERTAVY